jgi:hypothetical protein
MLRPDGHLRVALDSHHEGQAGSIIIFQHYIVFENAGRRVSN